MTNIVATSRLLRLILLSLISLLSLALLGCASDSSNYQYELSAYQIGDKPVHVIYRPNPSDYYTRISKGYSESGVTELTLTLNNLGKVVKLELVKSSGYSRLDTSASALAYGMIFESTNLSDGATRDIKLFVNFHKEKIVPPVKVTNVTSRVELLTGFQYRVIVGAIANPQGFMESVYPLEGVVQTVFNEDALGYGSRYVLESYPDDQRAEKQDLRLQITFN